MSNPTVTAQQSQAEAIDRLAQRYAALESQLNQRTWELEEALRVAEESARSKAGLLAVMSHELRNPLHAMLAIAQILQDTQLDPEQHRKLDTLKECGDALLHLINDILEFSKLESGRLQLESTEFSLEDLQRQLEAMFATIAKQRGLTLRFAIDDHVPRPLKGDPNRLRQVLVNLISNALKFTERGGVSVRCELAEESAIPDVANVRWTVTDTGIGMNPEEIARLFQPYAQANETVHRKFGGTGLGLAICDQLIKAMDGHVDVRSVPGKGSKFAVTVPLAVPRDEIPEFSNTGIIMQLTNVHGIARLSPLHVLVVDDDQLNRMITHTFASEFGAITEEAFDGLDAVKRLQDPNGEPFDLVLLDMSMPELDGPATARLIRELPLARQPRIIAVTGNDTLEDRERCAAAGMDDLLGKPFRREQLFEKLAETVAATRA